MTDSLATRGVCCGHTLNWHFAGGEWSACANGGCPCEKYISPNSAAVHPDKDPTLSAEVVREQLALAAHGITAGQKVTAEDVLDKLRRHGKVVPNPKPAGHDHADDEACTAACTQVGGDHYVKRAVGPWDIWAEYGMNAFEGAVLKYLLRWRDKNGVEDLKKARHTLDKLIEIEEAKGDPEAG